MSEPARIENRKSVQLPATRFKNIEFVRKTWHVVPPVEHSYDDFFRPEYWAHISNKLRVGDLIEVLAEDQSYWAQLLVVSVGHVAAQVRELVRVEIFDNAPEVEVAPAFEVKWKGPQMKYAIVRISDGAVILSELQTKDEASKSLNEYIRALSR